MPRERRLRILEQLGGAKPGEQTKHLCRVSAEITQMDGAGIMLMSVTDGPRGSLCSSNSTSDLIERLQYDLSEGPCVDAYAFDRAVLEPDLHQPVRPRWLAFRGPALEAGVAAVFGFPMHIGAVRLGALNLFRSSPGNMSDDQHADALVMADIAAEYVLALQANDPGETVAFELAAGADFHHVVHQATGMVAAQLGVSVEQALVRLRAYAFGNDRALRDVAADIVARALRFGDGSGRSDG